MAESLTQKFARPDCRQQGTALAPTTAAQPWRREPRLPRTGRSQSRGRTTASVGNRVFAPDFCASRNHKFPPPRRRRLLSCALRWAVTSIRNQCSLWPTTWFDRLGSHPLCVLVLYRNRGLLGVLSSHRQHLFEILEAVYFQSCGGDIRV
jgi:hypothetical protein